jgi:MFS family permease
MSATEITVASKAAPIPGMIRRNTFLLAGVQCVAWVALQVVATWGGITAAAIGEPGLVGLPVTLNIVAAALTAPIAGRLMDRLGRRPVLAIGLALLSAGAALAGIMIAARLFIGFLAALLLMGMGISAASLSRSAAADMYPASRRAQGLGVVVMGGAVGAIFGPFLLAGLRTWAGSMGWNVDAAAWLSIAPLTALGLLAVLFIRPDPREIGANLARYYPGEAPPPQAGEGVARPLSRILPQFPIVVAIAATGLVQAGMVMLMVTVALTIKGHGHDDVALSSVMSAHFLGMLGFSVPIGRLADRLGRRSMILVGALIFIAGATTAPLVNDPLINGTSLFLVGLGWSFCYVAGNTILADFARPTERGRLFGANDLIVGSLGAAASLTGGFILNDAGFLTVGIIGLILGTITMALAMRLRETSPGEYARSDS